jgi:hypothetical protein
MLYLSQELRKCEKETMKMEYGKKYKVEIFGDIEFVTYLGMRFSQNFNFGKGCDVYLLEREEDGSWIECLPEYVNWEEVQA